MTTAILHARKADDVSDVVADLAIAAGESDRAVAEKVASAWKTNCGLSDDRRSGVQP